GGLGPPAPPPKTPKLKVDKAVVVCPVLNWGFEDPKPVWKTMAPPLSHGLLGREEGGEKVFQG
ncbi:MAG: hypothetical protein RMM07_12585, partial [Anaerolineae bacterium]|nr:hypothetical protein [Anaerolineae bacterium]